MSSTASFASCVSFRDPAFVVDCKDVLRPPRQLDAAAPLFERLGRGALEVLPDDLEHAAALELDGVTGDHAGVDDVADLTALLGDSRLRRLVLGVHADLLGPDRDLPPTALEHVRDPDEAGDELGGG